MSALPENPYLLLTPGPLSTSQTVKSTMLRDWCTWDDDYNNIVQSIRARLLQLAHDNGSLTCALMQGSGTFCVESVIGSSIPASGRLLVLANGAYGARIGKIAECLQIPVVVRDFGEVSPVDANEVARCLEDHPQTSHVAVVHCETTTGMLNPINEISEVVKGSNKTLIVDAMSSFGGIEMDLPNLGADFVISSANKCIQGVPGFGFIIATRGAMQECNGRARSLSLDLYDQWHSMEQGGGKWRFTSPTHTVRAFEKALDELDEEGGVSARAARYATNQENLVTGMRERGFEPLLTDEFQSPFITSFLSPQHPDYNFGKFYERLKANGFVIYPGKVTGADTFRIGNIGEVYPDDIEQLLQAVSASMYWA
ncbi:MAG: 2-aminoethylphosphonate--pyruvate transaminase [Pseudomonadota bacterium]